jgi:hypothetical protein
MKNKKENEETIKVQTKEEEEEGEKASNIESRKLIKRLKKNEDLK